MPLRAAYFLFDFLQLQNGVNINDPQYFTNVSADRMKTMSSCGYSSFCGYAPVGF